MSAADPIGPIPYRIGLAGGWIDQPFVSRYDPEPPGSMVVVSVKPTFWYMERSGIATSTRNIALRLWPDGLPAEDPDVLVRRLYEEENRDRAQPSGSQDMIGLIHPGISRLDYDVAHEGGVFPVHMEATTDPEIARWLESVLNILPVAPRPRAYDALVTRNLDPVLVRRLGQSGAECFDAILARDTDRLGAAVNESMHCWEAILPASIRHPSLTVDWAALLAHYQARYPGAMCSASGGGYLYVISSGPVPGAFHPEIRLDRSAT